MLTRAAIPVVVLLAVLALALVACSNGQPTSTPAIPTPAQASVPTPAASLPASEHSYLSEEIPPCTPILGSSIDPCEPDFRVMSLNTSEVIGSTPWSLRFYLDRSSGPGIWVGHIVLRGTYIPSTVRCIPGGESFRHLPAVINRWYSGWVAGSIKCYADVRVNDYILGSGPPTLTVLVDYFIYYPTANSRSSIEEVLSRIERVLIEGGRTSRKRYPEGGITGREAVLFIGPALDASIESWQVYFTWGIERQDDGTVVAVHPNRDDWKNLMRDLNSTVYQTYRSSLLEMELPAFKQAVTAAHQARVAENGGRVAPASMEGMPEGVEWPMLVIDANRLDRFLTEIGAYDHPDGPPAQPPAVYTCDNAAAVPDSISNRGLVRDCSALLDGKDTLRGAADLDWTASSAVTGWEGVTTEGTPSKVTRVELPSQSLNGSIPAQVGNLLGLTHLDLSNNSLTGEIPGELGRLENLTSLKLSGNSLTGCIPLALKDVASNDLSSLNLLYCRPPAPENLRAGAATEAGIPLIWDAVSNASKYRVDYWTTANDGWRLDDDAITGTSHTVDGRTCDDGYRFQVSAYGDGATYAVAWSDWSAIIVERTAQCVRRRCSTHPPTPST